MVQKEPLFHGAIKLKVTGVKIQKILVVIVQLLDLHPPHQADRMEFLECREIHYL